MTSGFTDMEIAILEWICAADPRAGNDLRVLLKTADIAERDNTGHGFYTNFTVKHAGARPIPGERMMNGPVAQMANMGDRMMMGFILWLKDGYPDCLEGYQYGDASGNTVNLKECDLALLTFTRLESPP